MVARSKYLRENLVKQDGTPATDDEFEKTLEEEAQMQVQAASLTSLRQLGAKSKASEDPAIKLAKSLFGGGKQKKERNDVRISSEAPEQIAEISAVEEVPSNRPPTPPKPKTLLPPLDLGPYLR